MAKDKLQKGIEGTTFKPKKQFMGVFGDSKAVQKKYYDMTSAAKRDAHKKGRSEGKKFRARTFVDRETGTLRLDTVSNRKRFGKKVYKAPDVSYVEPRKYSKGGLKGNQKKLDKNKNNRIDAEDFKILRGQGKGAMKARLGSRVPPVIRPKPTAGGKPLTPKPIKPKPKPKMGGGMMKKPGYKYGKMIEDKFNKYARSKETQLHSKDALEGFNRAEKRSVSETMGEYKKDIKKYEKSKLKRLTRFSKGGGADTGTAGERRSKLMTAVDRLKRRIDVRKRRPKYIKPPERKSMIPADVGKVAQSLTPTGIGKQMGRKVMGKMGGGMMMKPMGYKSGTSVKVKCKLGRNKPTKMY